jgi:DNA-binding transcriptional ArsR family regulator
VTAASPDLDTRILDDIIENVSESAPALLPFFRSEQQLRIVAELFTGADGELPIGELAERAGVAQATASREVARLEQHGIVVTRALGRNTLVRANWDLPWANELRSILAQTVGVLGRIAEVLARGAAVEDAYIFGSWAARYLGEPGPPPRDVDVLVVGGASLRSVQRSLAPIERDLGIEINPVVMESSRWHADRPEPFVAQLRKGPLVPVPLERP